MKRRGFTLVEIVFTLSLTTVAMTLASKLIVSVLHSEAQITTSERDASVSDRAIHRLRVDLENSSSVRLNAGTLALDGTRWNSDGDALTRTAGTQREQFDLPAPPHLSSSSSGITLQIGEATWSLPAPAMLTRKSP